MSMSAIQSTLASAGKTAYQGTIVAAQWLGKTVTVVGTNAAKLACSAGSQLAIIAKKIVDVARPLFANAGSFIAANKGPLAIGAVVGAIGFAIFSAACCSSQSATA